MSPLDRLFGKDQVVVYKDLKCASARGYEVEIFYDVLIIVQEVRYRANCAVRVVSRDTVFDNDAVLFHAVSFH